MERLVEIEKYNPEEENAETSLRPNIWSEYIGQEQIKKNLGVFIEASKKRAEALDHVLFFWSSRSWQNDLSSDNCK